MTMLQATISALFQLVARGGVPFLVYLAYHRRRHGRSLRDVLQRAGLQIGHVRYVWLGGALADGVHRGTPVPWRDRREFGSPTLSVVGESRPGGDLPRAAPGDPVGGASGVAAAPGRLRERAPPGLVEDRVWVDPRALDRACRHQRHDRLDRRVERASVIWGVHRGSPARGGGTDPGVPPRSANSTGRTVTFIPGGRAAPRRRWHRGGPPCRPNRRRVRATPLSA